MLRHLGLIAVCACIVASVGCEGGLSPSPRPTPTPPPPSPNVTVEFGGRVVNADAEGPVENVRVLVQSVGFDGHTPAGWVNPKDTATSGGNGTFTLPLNLPIGWRSVRLQLSASAHDDTYWHFWPAIAADRPAIRMYPTLVIRPGESIEVRVEGIEQCGWGGEAGACRRVLVAASSGDPVELELVPDDSRKPMGLSPDNYLGAYMPVPRLMVPPGGFPYVIGDGTARLTARR